MTSESVENTLEVQGSTTRYVMATILIANMKNKDVNSKETRLRATNKVCPMIRCYGYGARQQPTPLCPRAMYEKKNEKQEAKNKKPWLTDTNFDIYI